MKKIKKTVKSSLENFTPILVIISVVLAFAVGILWQKVNSLDGTSAAQIATKTNSGNTQADSPAPPEKGEVLPVTEDDHVRGDRNARIALIEYSDLECPFCERFHPTAQQAVDEYPGEVMWVYRHFPLDQIHPKARPAAEVSECVFDLAGDEAFWTFVDSIFANQAAALSDLTNAALESGVNQSALESCIDSGEFAQKVEDHYQGGLQAGVTGTPGNILLDTQTGNTQLIPGAVPYPQLKQAIDDMLSG